MFDKVGRVVDHAWHQHHTRRQLCFLPHPPLMLVPHVGGLAGIGLCLHPRIKSMMCSSGRSIERRRSDCRLLPSALVRRTDQPRLSDRPARRQPRRDAGGIRCVKRGGARAHAEPSLVRGSGHLAMRCGDCLGRSNWPSPGHRGRDRRQGSIPYCSPVAALHSARSALAAAPISKQ